MANHSYAQIGEARHRSALFRVPALRARHRSDVRRPNFRSAGVRSMLLRFGSGCRGPAQSRLASRPGIQLIWQVAGLAFLFHVGSPQSKEGDDRMEAKLDAILRAVDDKADKLIDEIDTDYAGRHTDHRYIRQRQG